MTPSTNRIACVAIVKNEQNHVAEWIAYQLAIGFDTIILFDNQSTDQTASRARTFATAYDVRVLDWTMTTPDYQTLCYDHAARAYADEFDWLAFFDIDEYLVLNPAFDLKSILNLWTDTAAIGIPWAMFGSSGHADRPAGLLIESFTHRSEQSFGPNRHIKSIIRPKRMIHCQNAHGFAMDGDYRSLAGTPLTFTQGGLLDTDPDYTMGKLHHYFTRSRAHWTDKMNRGYHDTTRADTEFDLYDRNEIPDTSATRQTLQIHSILSALNPDHPNAHPVIGRSAATRQSSPATNDHSPPTQEPASISLLKERTKEPLPPETPNSPGTWALLTEFGTLLCWNPTDQKLSHRPTNDVDSHWLAVWKTGEHDELRAFNAGEYELLDHRTGRLASLGPKGKLAVEPGERTQDVAFNLGDGRYLSAREGERTHGPGPVDHYVKHRQAWECFTPITLEKAQKLLERPDLQMVSRDQVQVGTKEFPIDEIFSAAATKNQIAEDPNNKNDGAAKLNNRTDVKKHQDRQYVIAACARWEARYIEEWLVYHQMIGFSHVYLYSNDDQPSELYEKVLPFLAGDNPFVTYLYYPYQGHHRNMMRHFVKNYSQSCKWICFLDIDEFIRLSKDEKIPTFLSRYQHDADCVMLNWLPFGTNGHKTPPDCGVLEAYTKRERSLHPFTKYIAKSNLFLNAEVFQKCDGNEFVHNLDKYSSVPIKSVNVLGEKMASYYDNFPEHACQIVHDRTRHDRILATACIHHYAFRSEQAFRDRASRGLSGNFAGEIVWSNLAQSAEYENFLTQINAVQDETLANFWRFEVKKSASANVFGVAEGALLSRNCKTTQSTTSQWSKSSDPDTDSSGAVDGKPNGGYKFHTSLEESPWWMADLARTSEIKEIRIFNRIDSAELSKLASKLAIEVSADGRDFLEIYRRAEEEPFGGVDGSPLKIAFQSGVVGRYVRVRLLRRGYLHLDQIEIFGEHVDSQIQNQATSPAQ